MFDANDFLDRAEAAGCMVRVFAENGRQALFFSYEPGSVNKKIVTAAVLNHGDEIIMAQMRRQHAKYFVEMGVAEQLC